MRCCKRKYHLGALKWHVNFQRAAFDCPHPHPAARRQQTYIRHQVSSRRNLMRFMLRSRSLLFALFLLVMSVTSFAQVAVTISFGPPALPVYEQPFCPGEGYIWTPGYWAYDYNYGDYYWVPGTWVLAPEVGYLWTPPYWGWGGNGFLFREGYWGPQVGFYGGI